MAALARLALGPVATRGRPPRRRRTAAAVQRQRARRNPVRRPLPGRRRAILLFTLNPVRAGHAAPLIAVLEWAGRQGAATVALLAEPPPHIDPWDRVLHGAEHLQPPPAPAASRLIRPATPDPVRGSASERRLRAALRADPDLGTLFEDEVTLALGTLGAKPRVDLLWRSGQVVVELDGLEHERDPNYGADRHRDYELLVAGYLVLRLTNAEVDLDLARSVEKVRRVVNLRRTSRD